MAAKLARSQRTASRGAAPNAGRSLLTVGDLLGSKYRVERLLGEGGMGVVVAAYHELLDQRVAVKLLYQDVADREAQSRLLLEARAAAKLQSEHVARVIDVDMGQDGLPFIVMELLEGADLCQIADTRGALPPWLVVDYVLQALEGLAHAHARGIIHRDLKPSNLFLANRADGVQVIKILDFGISKSADRASDRRSQQLTGGHAVLGSPPYMSPEQVRSPRSVDHRTDIWSVGICMYELLTNSMPFGGDELQETFAQILEKDPATIRSLVAGVPEGLERIVWRCLAKKREDRFANVAELARALVPFGSGAWAQYADRAQATLDRGAVDEVARGRGSPPSDRIAIPLSPGRRLDSVQPELNGTASTVAGRFDPKRHWVVAAIAVPAIVGVALIGVTAARRGTRAAAIDGALTAAPPPSVSAVGDPSPSAAEPSSPSPAEPSSPSAAEPSSPSAAEPSNVAVEAASSGTPVASATTATKVARPFRSPGVVRPSPKPASPLPAGLPQTRSGQ